MFIGIEPLDFFNVHGVAELEKICFGPYAWSEEMLEHEIIDGNKHYTVAFKDDGEVIGYGGFIHVFDEGDIMDIAVHPKFRRQGVATAIINEFFDQSQFYDIKSFTLEVRDSNEAAKKLYEKMGFVCVGKRPGYYPDKEDACIYWKYMLGGDDN